MADFSLRYHEYLNDPIWGEIPVTEIEWDIINTSIFRRLQHIKQMGMAYLSFPTANHRRLEHCIGTMHVANFLFEILTDLIEQEKLDIKLNAQHLQTVRLAALLHDIGHPPYSHAFEEAISKNSKLIKFNTKTIFRGKNKIFRELFDNPNVYNHELFTRYIIENDDSISSIINNYAETLSNFPIQEISLLATGNASYSGLKPFNMILSGDFDADRIDYICRDSYYCGFHQKFNISDFRRNLYLKITEGKSKIELLLKKDVIPAITTLLWYRYRLSKSIHLDKRNRIATQMLIHLFNELYINKFGSRPQNETLDREKLELILDIHTKYTDEDFNNFLKEYVYKDSVQNLIKGDIWDEVECINRRDLMPKEKLWIHFFTQKPKLISSLEKKYGEKIQLEDCHIDVRLSKAPKFKTLVKDPEEREPRSIFDNFYTPHGIMIDTFNTMSIFIYHDDYEKYKRISKSIKIENFPDVFPHSAEGWRFYLYDSLLETYKEDFEDRCHKRILKSLEFLILYMGIVDELSKQFFDVSPWLQGDGRLQICIKIALDKLKDSVILKPNPDWSEGNYSLDIFIDFEILSHAGLIDHVHTPIKGPGSLNPWFESRIDRKINLKFGMPYYTEHLKETWAYQLIHKEMYDIFNKNKDTYKKYILVYNKLKRKRYFEPEFDKLNNETELLRNKLSKSGFPPLEPVEQI